jgi:hypothetical protein
MLKVCGFDGAYINPALVKCITVELIGTADERVEIDLGDATFRIPAIIATEHFGSTKACADAYADRVFRRNSPMQWENGQSTKVSPLVEP